MTILMVVLHIFVCLFLIAVILLQAGRGQGLSWGVFGGSPQSILGTKSASFLTRVTTICASFFLVTCIVLNIIETRKSRSLFAPSKTTSQIDLAKIKEAIEEAQKQTPEAASSVEAIPVTPVIPSATEIPLETQDSASSVESAVVSTVASESPQP
jgi:preprotein translocase subunit SecG